MIFQCFCLTQCLSSACRLKKGTPRSENFRRNTPIIAKIPPKDPITKNPVTSREFGHPCVEVFARVSFEGFKSDASGEWGWMACGLNCNVWKNSCLDSLLRCCKCSFTFSCAGPFGFEGYMVVYFGFNDLRTCPVTTTSGLNPVYRQNGRRILPWAAGGPARFFIFSWT